MGRRGGARHHKYWTIAPRGSRGLSWALYLILLIDTRVVVALNPTGYGPALLRTAVLAALCVIYWDSWAHLSAAEEPQRQQLPRSAPLSSAAPPSDALDFNAASASSSLGLRQRGSATVSSWPRAIFFHRRLHPLPAPTTSSSNRLSYTFSNLSLVPVLSGTHVIRHFIVQPSAPPPQSLSFTSASVTVPEPLAVIGWSINIT